MHGRLNVKLPKPRSSSSLVMVTKSNDACNIRVATTFSTAVTKVQYDQFR